MNVYVRTYSEVPLLRLPQLSSKSDTERERRGKYVQSRLDI